MSIGRIFTTFSAVFIYCSLTTVSASTAWLAAQQQPSGAVVGVNDVATELQSTSEALTTLQILSSEANLSGARAFVNADDFPSTEHLSRKVGVAVAASVPSTTLVGELLTHQNADGGFGELPGYQSTPLDTAFALTALYRAGQITTPQNLAALTYLISTQSAAGSWSLDNSEASVYVTAYALEALWPFRQRLPSVVTSAARARTYLLSQVQSDGLWSSDFESALALIALAPTQASQGELNSTVTALTAHRLGDGSWNQDVYVTALALRAIALATAPNANPDLARISGVIADGDSRVALSGLAVRLTGATSASRTTGSHGEFEFLDLAPGTYSLSVQAQGYPPFNASLGLKAGQSLDLGTLHLLREGQSSVARIEGHITNSAGADLAGVTVQVSGASSAQTDVSGRYLIGEVPPGPVTITASKPGYFTAQGSTTLLAGSTVNFSPALRDVQTAGFNVVGTFTDSATSQALAGVEVAISGSASANAVSNASGTVSLSSLVPGLVRIEVSLAGYATRTVIVTANGGQTLDISTSLEAVPPEAPQVFSVRGRVTDEISGAPVVGANVLVSGDVTASAVTDSAGSYALESLPSGSFTITASAAGYRTASASATAQPFQSIDFSPALVAISVEPTAVRAFVADAQTGEPIEGATILVTSSSAHQSAQSAPNGAFLIRDLEAVETTVTIQAIGYEARALTFTPFAGVLNDLGTLALLPEAHAQPVTLTGRVVNSTTDAAVAGASVTASSVSGVQSVLSGSDGRFSVTLTSGMVADFEVASAGYGSSIFTLLVSPESADLGQVRMRPEGLDTLRADLFVAGVDAGAVTSSPDTYVVQGSVTAHVQNRGYVAVPPSTQVVAFEDRDRDGELDADDLELGRVALAGEIAPGELRSIVLQVSGSVSFRDAPITVLADADQTVIERLEDNNTNVSVGSCVAIPPAASALSPILKWRWAGSPQRPNENTVYGPVMVGQLTDDNGDGSIDAADVPDLVFSTQGQSLTVVSGDDGRTLWQSAPSTVTGLGSPALADIDGDGLLEIVISNGPRTRLLAFEHDGTLKWSVANAPTHSDTTRDGITIADLNQDGVPEIITGRRVYSNTGTLLWQGTGDSGGLVSYGTLPIAVDLDGDGSKEVLAGRTAYRANGTILWNQTSAAGDGFNAVGNFDTDEFPEVVLVAIGRVYLLEHTGAIKWGPVTLSGANSRGGAPTVGDFDGDGQPEIGIAGASFYTVLETDGSLKWRKSIQDASSAFTGSSLFDFDGDGRIEVVYADEQNLFIWDGATGNELFRVANRSGTTLEYPVVADVDGDGRAELIVAANDGNLPGVRVFEGGQGEWMPTRAIWNQSTYHIDNVNDDGTIPAVETQSWRTHNTYRANAAVQRQAEPVADLTAGALILVDHGIGQPASLRVRVGNAGAVVDAGLATVAFYDGDPTAGGRLLGSASVPKLASGEYADVQLDGITSVSAGGTLFAVADATRRITECNELNNTSMMLGRPALGTITAATLAPVYASGETVSIRTAVTNSGLFASAYRVKVDVRDPSGNIVAALPDGDVPTLASGAAYQIPSSLDSGGLIAGTYQVHAHLFDINGTQLATAVTSFELRHDPAGGPAASLRVATDRSVYHTRDVVSIAALSGNLTTASLISGAQLRLNVTAAQGASLLDQVFQLGELVPGAVRQLGHELTLSEADEGSYTVSGTLLDATGTVLASAATTFAVVNDPLVSVTGTVSVASSTVPAGEAQLCTRSVTNRSAGALQGLALRYLVVRLTDEALLEQQDVQVNVAAGGSTADVRTVATMSYSPGEYACTLQANLAGQWRDLAYATFSVTAQAFRVETILSTEGRGRLLILVDAPNGQDAGDPFSGPDVPDLNTQRTHLESVLDAAGWSYTIVTCDADFEREFNTGGYAAYAILSEAVKLSVSLQNRVVDAVHAGAGLFVSGNHDRRNSKLEEALGVKSLGKSLDVRTLVVEPSVVMEAGEEEITIERDALEIRLEGATPFARYRLAKSKGNQETTAATRFTFGQGRSIYVSVDLPLLGAGAGDDSLFAELFLRSLAYIHPASIAPRVRSVLPLRVAVTNEGAATSGRVVLTLPQGVSVIDANGWVAQSDSVWVRAYALQESVSAELPLWVKLPAQPADITFRTITQTGIGPDYTDQDMDAITIRVLPYQ